MRDAGCVSTGMLISEILGVLPAYASAGSQTDWRREEAIYCGSAPAACRV
jgi:hypothetical protein